MQTTQLAQRFGFAALGLGALSAPSFAQFTFSIDFHGPTRSAADCAGVTIGEGDILTPCTGGVPAMPVVPGPLPTPMIVTTGGALGIPGYTGCMGAPPGVACAFNVELDALSYGADSPMDPMMFNPGGFWLKAGLHFSVDEFAVGIPTGVPPAVLDESGIGDAAADIFRDVGFTVPPPLPPFATATPGNIADTDGDGRPGFPTYWAYPGTGLIEPTGPGVPPDLGDNLDAVDVDGFGIAFPVYFSCDSGFVDPRNGFPNSGTAATMGFVGGDVLVTLAPGGPPALFAPAGALGLDVFGPDQDDLDALILVENGSGAYEPSITAYDWLGGGSDMLLFSVREGSTVIGMPDSLFGLPIQAGDILSTPLPMGLGGVSPFPSIFIAAENIGLEVSALRGGAGAFGDDLDALDFSRQPSTLHQEYCFGDGGLAGCVPCACGNSDVPGSQNGCLNSAGTGARLWTMGNANVGFDSLRFELTGATPASFAMLTSAPLRIPLVGPCPAGSGIAAPVFDGLRCIGGGFTRYPVRPTDAAGDVGLTNAGWGAPSGPPGGLIAFGGLAACSTVQWQVLYRDTVAFGCGTGINTSQGVQTIILP